MDRQENHQNHEKFKKFVRFQKYLSLGFAGVGLFYAMFAGYLAMSGENIGTFASVLGAGLAIFALGFAIYGSARTDELTLALAVGLDNEFGKLNEKIEEISKQLKKNP
jgi:hypothetical protein